MRPNHPAGDRIRRISGPRAADRTSETPGRRPRHPPTPSAPADTLRSTRRRERGGGPSQVQQHLVLWLERKDFGCRVTKRSRQLPRPCSEIDYPVVRPQATAPLPPDKAPPPFVICAVPPNEPARARRARPTVLSVKDVVNDRVADLGGRARPPRSGVLIPCRALPRSRPLPDRPGRSS